MVAVRETIIYLIVFCALLPPAKKFAKVMFLQLSVSHSVHGGGFCIGGGGALGRPPPHSDTTEYGQSVGGTHPTGMHSC